MISQDDIDAFKDEAGQVSSENIREYFKELRYHDWYYEYSDDYRVWKRGSDNSDMLRNKSHQNVTYRRMYKEFIEWMNSERELPVIEEFINYDKEV